jgi:hypothetical protein
MTAELLRAAHAPVWVIYAVVFGLYILTVSWWMLNGYTRELFGSPLPHMGRIHKVVYNFHTGLPVKNMKTSGDQRHLRRIAGNTSRATPEGSTVYWHKWKRWQRAVRNNAIVLAYLLTICTMAIDPADTVRAVTVAVLVLFVALVWLLVRRKREQYRKSHPVSKPALAHTKRAKAVLGADPLTDGRRPKLEAETKPELTGVPQTVLAKLLAPELGCSTAEVVDGLKMSPAEGSLVLPDSFSAVERKREPVEEIIRAHTDGKVSFKWRTTVLPRMLSWEPVIEHKLPAYVRFRDYLSELEHLDGRDFGVGVVADRSMYAATHDGDFPWHCRFAGPGTGKSTGFLVKAAQICHRFPADDVYCIDTKQISFKALRGIPRVHVYDRPESEMDKIWKVFYELHGIMKTRYTAVSEGRISLEDLINIWILIDEGNDLAANLKSYSRRVYSENTPAIWGEAIAPLMRMGRQARMFGEFMCQDLDGRMFGGETLKSAFNLFGAAGFTPNQLTRTIGGKAEDSMEGPGKILMCRGKKREWVQAFCDDEDYLREYALENREEIAA